jgi:hypothetical protein
MKSRITAKPISSDFWIITKDDSTKIGNIINDNGQLKLTIKTITRVFNNIEEIEKVIPINFLTIDRNITPINPMPDYPTHCLPYNSSWDYRKNYHLYTAEPHLTCQYVAGWFKVMEKTGKVGVKFCPKNYLLDTYLMRKGPFMTEEEANANR